MHSFSKRDILEVDAPAKRSAQKKVSLVFNKDRNLKELLLMDALKSRFDKLY